VTTEFNLEGVVPWGRSSEEYLSFFSLSRLPSSIRILDCGGGPSSFTIEMTRLGFRAVSVDPLYGLERDVIEERMRRARQSMLDGFAKARDRFAWTFFKSPEASVEYRMATMRRFLADYDSGRAAGRYVQAALPSLPFPDQAFDITLSSHLLFLYDHLLDLEFHLASVREMLRVGVEARIFPILDLSGNRSSLVEPVIDAVGNEGFAVSIVTVPYEFQKGGNQMIRVARPSFSRDASNNA
jgi:hypothetical protein